MFILGLLLFLAPCAAVWPRSWIVGMACGKAAEFYYPECGYGNYSCICGSIDLKATVVDCIARHTAYNSSNMGDAWNRFSLMYCDLNGMGDEVGDMLSTFANPVTKQISDANFTRAYNAEYHLLSQKDVSVRFSLGLCIFWIGIAVIAALGRLGHKATSSLVGSHLLLKNRHPRWYRWLERRFFWPAFYGGRHMVNYRFGWVSLSLGSRFESLVILAFLLLCFIFMLTPYTFMDDDPFFETRWKEMMRYASDRSGIMGTILMPLFLLFGMRNNILIWATGWSYARFNVFHRAIARISYALLIVHSVTKHIFAASYHGSMSEYFYSTPLYQYGVAAMFLMAIMIVFASLRSKIYRIFHHVHVICGFAGLMCAIYHLDRIGYQEPLYLCFAVWAADWALRLGRILVFNFSTLFPPIPGSHRVSYASVNLFNDEVARLTIHLPVKWKFHPGQYVYLYPHRYWLLNGHPFSVVGSSSSGDGIVLMIKARNGMTKRLCRYLADKGCNEQSPVTIPVFIEGPYGISAPIHCYDEGLLIAGGIGITGILGYVEKMRDNFEDARIRNIHLVWVVQSKRQFSIAKDQLLALKASGRVEISLYCREKPRSHNKFPEQVAAASGENVVVDYNPGHESISVRSTSTNESNSSSTHGKNTNDESSADFSYGGLELCRSTTNLTLNSEKRSTPYYEADLEHRINTLAEAGLDDLSPVGESSDKESGNPFSDSVEECGTLNNFEGLEGFISEVRPDINEIVREFFNLSKGSTCVAACGPPSLMDTTAAAVCNYMEFVEYGQVHYYEEAFIW